MLYIDIALFNCPQCDKRIKVHLIEGQEFHNRIETPSEFQCPECKSTIKFSDRTKHLFRLGVLLFLFIPFVLLYFKVTNLAYLSSTTGLLITAAALISQKLVLIKKYETPKTEVKFKEKKYKIKIDRINFIRDNFFQWSFHKPDDFIPDKILFNKLTHPAELHYLADIYNWDDSEVVLEWILDSPMCSRSTANLLFWRARPDFYLKYDIYQDNWKSLDYGGLSVIKKVLEKYKNSNFSDFEIEFDPKDELEEITEKNPQWAFPNAIYDKIEGVKVIIR